MSNRINLPPTSKSSSVLQSIREAVDRWKNWSIGAAACRTSCRLKRKLCCSAARITMSRQDLMDYPPEPPLQQLRNTLEVPDSLQIWCSKQDTRRDQNQLQVRLSAAKVPAHSLSFRQLPDRDTKRRNPTRRNLIWHSTKGHYGNHGCHSLAAFLLKHAETLSRKKASDSEWTDILSSKPEWVWGWRQSPSVFTWTVWTNGERFSKILWRLF